MMLATAPQASLLGLPKELRLQIYDYVRATRIQYRPITRWDNRFATSGSNGTYTGFYCLPLRDQDSELRLPWLDLMRSCRSIHTEMEAYMRSTAAAAGPGADADLEVELCPKSSTGTNLGPVVWTAIRVPLHRANVLLVNMDCKPRFRVWGNGGPMHVLRNMYQALNYLVHCGPRMDPERQLPTPLRLRELIINIRDVRDIAQGLDSTANQPQRRADFVFHLRAITQMGFVGRHVDVVTVRSMSTEERHVLDKELVGNPVSWEGYGFGWGMEVYREDGILQTDVER